MTTSLEATADLVPEGATATHAFRIVFFIAEDGDEQFSFAHAGSANLSTWLGGLELVKDLLLSELRREERIGVDLEEDT
jgi:hypothetical protein